MTSWTEGSPSAKNDADEDELGREAGGNVHTMKRENQHKKCCINQEVRVMTENSSKPGVRIMLLQKLYTLSMKMPNSSQRGPNLP